MSGPDYEFAVGAELESTPFLLDADSAEAYNRALDSPPRRKRPKNIHSDAGAAAKAGFTAPIAGGEQTFALIAQFLASKFGTRFLRGGRIDISLTRPVLYGDSLVSHAVVEREEKELLRLKIWIENQHGDRVLEGTASVRRQG
jgi:acyl dehydratase